MIPQLPENNVVKLTTLFFCNASERRVISIYMTTEEWEQNNQDFLKESYEETGFTAGGYFTMSTPKTAAGKRAIPILPEVRKALEQERTNQQELELVCEYEIDGISDFVFLNRFGQPQNPQTVNRAIKRISVAYNEAELEKAEKEKREPQLLPPFSCHNLRHTFCTRLCENETNLKIIQDIMGHRDISTTMEIYAEATKEAKAHSFANLNGKLGISV